jgi:hypothetical protein
MSKHYARYRQYAPAAFLAMPGQHRKVVRRMDLPPYSAQNAAEMLDYQKAGKRYPIPQPPIRVQKGAARAGPPLLPAIMASRTAARRSAAQARVHGFVLVEITDCSGRCRVASAVFAARIAGNGDLEHRAQPSRARGRAKAAINYLVRQWRQSDDAAFAAVQRSADAVVSWWSSDLYSNGYVRPEYDPGDHSHLNAAGTDVVVSHALPDMERVLMQMGFRPNR